MKDNMLAKMAAELELIRPQIVADGNDLIEIQGQTIFPNCANSGVVSSLLAFIGTGGDIADIIATFPPAVSLGFHKIGNRGLFVMELIPHVDMARKALWGSSNLNRLMKEYASTDPPISA